MVVSFSNAPFILVVGSQAMVREMIAQACAHLLPSARVETCGDDVHTVEQCGQLVPDVVLVDLAALDDDGFMLVQRLAVALPLAKLVVLCVLTDDYQVHRLLEGPVNALLDKEEEPLAMLGAAVGEVLAGRRYLAPGACRIRSGLRADPHAFSKVLSAREQQLLALFGQGLSNDEVAAQHGLSVHTAKIHRRNIMGKVGVHSTPQLIRYALEKGFTRIQPAAKRRPDGGVARDHLRTA